MIAHLISISSHSICSTLLIDGRAYRETPTQASARQLRLPIASALKNFSRRCTYFLVFIGS
jgi:hypothetical protein